MRITYRGDYALKAVFQLAVRCRNDGDCVMSISEIAKKGDMPTKFLEQILLALRKGGFVKSKRGIKGGFCLARPARDITVGQVIRFVDGPIEPIACIEHDHYKGCRDIKCCIFRDVWKDLHEAVSGVVDTLTFEDLIGRYKGRGVGLKKDRRHSQNRKESRGYR